MVIMKERGRGRITGVTGRPIERNIQKLQYNEILRRVGSPKGGYREVLE